MVDHKRVQMAAKFITILFWFFLLYDTVENEEKSKPYTGPFKTILTANHKCEKVRPPYEKEPTILYDSHDCSATNNSGLLCGNITIKKVTEHTKVSAKGHILENGKWRVIFSTSSYACRGFLPRAFKLVLKIQSDDPCLPKDTIHFKNVDFNAINHIWLKNMHYGEYKWTFQIFTKGETSFCMEYYALTAPLTKH